MNASRTVTRLAALRAGSRPAVCRTVTNSSFWCRGAATSSPVASETARPTTFQSYTLTPNALRPSPTNLHSDVIELSLDGPGNEANNNKSKTARTLSGSIEQEAPTQPNSSKTSVTQSRITTQQTPSQPQSQPSTPPPTTSPSATQQAKPAPAPRRSRLRTPRKAALKLTESAVEQLRELLNQPEPKLIKVGVRNRGCSGLAYHLEYVDEKGAFDEEVLQDGVKVLIDSKALFSIIGSEMDWVEDKLSQKFVFKNPNIKDQCGCGESFMV